MNEVVQAVNRVMIGTIAVCGEECGDDTLHEIDIKGETKKICDECVDTIHGLM